MAFTAKSDSTPFAKTALPKPRTCVPSRRTIGLMMFAMITLLVCLRAAAEWSMMHEHGPDAQMGIWYMFMVIKIVLWSLGGLIAAGLLLAVWQRRWGRTAAIVLCAVWGVWICVASWQYLSARNALAAASNSSTTAERLQQLVNFSGLQAGYELDNRIAAHPNTPRAALRELYERRQLGTEMTLANNPNTPADILEELANHEEQWVRHNLMRNPKLPASIRDNLSDHADELVE